MCYCFILGDTIYGRVFWSPQQGLEYAYKLNINEIILCAGKSGFLPEYDPTGNVYGKGPQYGCLLPNRHLKYKFVLLVSTILECDDIISKILTLLHFHFSKVDD